MSIIQDNETFNGFALSKIAMINDNEVPYHLSSNNRDGYAELEQKGQIKYLGQGTIYKIGGIHQPFKRIDHFWY